MCIFRELADEREISEWKQLMTWLVTGRKEIISK